MVRLCRWCRGVETRQRLEREKNERRTIELLAKFAEEMKNVWFVPGKGFVRTRR